MVYEKVYTDTESCWTWKCLYCGDYVDPVILENREYQKIRRSGRKKHGSFEEPRRPYSNP
jgi:hypothetical protein